jgi:hypothetical protein
MGETPSFYAHMCVCIELFHSLVSFVLVRGQFALEISRLRVLLIDKLH